MPTYQCYPRKDCGPKRRKPRSPKRLPAFTATPPVRVAEIAAMAAEYDWHRHPNQPIFYPQQASVPVID